MYNRHTNLEFDPEKEARNLAKHGISFGDAFEVFLDPDVVHLQDSGHSAAELRWYAIGRIRDGRVITVWYTWRGDCIRIIGAAELRKWRKEYEKRKTARPFKAEVG